jgi:hypothetical protein
LNVKPGTTTSFRLKVLFKKKDIYERQTYLPLVKGEKYFLQVQYSCTNSFLDYYAAVNNNLDLNSLNKELDKIYVGQIVSNIIPIE